MIERKDKEQSKQVKTRTFQMNVVDPSSTSNSIKSTSTNIITFVPSNLLHQLKSLANVYFIIIAILQLIPAISLTNGRPTILIPLSVVMLTVLIKDAYEQFYRYLKDRQENNREVQVLRSNGFVLERWENIRAGNIIRVKKDELIPCDAVVLKTTLSQNRCFLQTKNLDGETNLKLRYGPKSRFNFLNLSNSELYNKRYEINCQQPNPFLTQFLGFLKVEGQQVPLDISNMLLRGCFLRNVPQAICISVYVGSDTKLILNSAKFSPKRSKLDKQISKMIISIFIWQVVIALVVSIFNLLFQSSYAGVMEYIQKSRFWFLASSWWLIMTYFVPISLTVTMEMVKLFQGSILGRDQRGYVPEFNCNATANNTSVNENLGQIRYVFTDKTGTLTKNQMSFKKLIVGKSVYGLNDTISEENFVKNYPQVTNVSFRDGNFMELLSDQKIQKALKIIYLCHDVSVETGKDGRIIYTSSSPQQIALINFGKLCGYELLAEEEGFTRIFDRKSNRTLKYQKLGFFLADSDRKRMSLVVRNPSNQIQILTKGADSILMKLLNKPKSMFIDDTQRFVDDFSTEGLRTLVLAQRMVSEEQFKSWKISHDNASVSLENRKEKLYSCYELLEKNLQLVGAVGIQDKLQDFVPETIKCMKAAGIKFYILTGDKKETAISIGRSCGLVESDAKLLEVPNFTQQTKTEWFDWLRRAKEDKGEKVYLVDASKPLPPDIPLHQTICYRCTPKQKKSIVQLVQNKTPQLTLAIGDGANDVNMITTADVGIGVRGKQGTQATRVSDFVIGQYSHLSFLTLYYGRQWYKKNCRLVAYNFYKNWFHVSAVVAYGAYSFFSATLIFDIFLYELFNLFFASMPIIVYAVFDEQFNQQESLAFPSLYEAGLSNKQFNQSVYHKSIGRGALNGFISLVVIFMCLQDNVLSNDGRMGYLAQSGAVLYSSIIININLRILILSTGITPFIIFSVYGSIIFYWFFYFLYTKAIDGDLTNSFRQQFNTIIILLVNILVISLLTLSQFAYEKYFQFDEKVQRLVRSPQNWRDHLVERLLIGQSFPKRDSGGNFIGRLLNVPSPDYKRRVMEPN